MLARSFSSPALGVFVVLMLSMHFAPSLTLSPVALDCSSDDGANSAKCKERHGTASLPNSKQLGSSIKDVLQHVDSLVGASGAGNKSGSGHRAADGVVASFEAVATSGKSQQDFIQQMMSLRQREIDEVSHVLVPKAQRTAVRELRIATALRANVTSLSQSMQRFAESIPEQQQLQQQRKLMQLVDKLTAMREGIERHQLEGNQFESILVQRSATVENADEDDDGADAIDTNSFLQLNVASPSLQAIQLLDEATAGLEEVRSLMRQGSEKRREEWNDELERQQTQVEGMLRRVRSLQGTARTAIAHSHELRSYVRELTATQYTSLKWHGQIAENVRNTASMFGAMNKLQVSALPLFDQLLHSLNQGEGGTPHNASMNNPCEMDKCGICNGRGVGCLACGKGVFGDGKALDVCGACAGEGAKGSSCSYFCDNVPNSGKLVDACGVCGGDDSSCVQ